MLNIVNSDTHVSPEGCDDSSRIIRKIAIISARRDPSIAPIDSDGGTIQMLEFANQLTQHGFQCDIFTRKESTKNTDEYLRQKALVQNKHGGIVGKLANGISVVRVPYESFNPDNAHDEVNMLNESASFATNLLPLLAEYDFILFQHLLSIAGFFINNTFLDLGIHRIGYTPQMLMANRGYANNMFERRIDCEREVFKTINNIFCCSVAEKATIQETYSTPTEKIMIMGAGFSPEIFRKKILPRSRFINILSPNAFREQKRYLEFLPEFVKTKREYQYARLIIVGAAVDIQYYNRTLSLASELGLSTLLLDTYSGTRDLEQYDVDIIILPAVSQVELSTLYSYCTLSIFPSKDETFGLSMLESLALGCLPICFEIPAYTSYIDIYRYRYAIPLESEFSKLGDTLIRALDESISPIFDVLKREISRTMQGYTWNAVGSKFAAHLQNVIDSPSMNNLC